MAFAVHINRVIRTGCNNCVVAGCGVYVQECPHDVIRLAGPWESKAQANVL